MAPRAGELAEARMTLEDLRSRSTISVPEAAELLGCSTRHAYELARSYIATGKGPLPAIALGRAIRVPARPLLETLEAQSEAG